MYTGPSPGVVAPDGTEFPLGITVPTDDDLAAALLLQGCFLTAGDYAAQQSAADTPVVAEDVAPPDDSTVTDVPIPDPTPDN